MIRIIVIALLLSAAPVHATPPPPPPPPQPNVLLIFADDLRPALGCYGDKIAQSPNIDRLAARGVRFERAYCQYPVCNPSRVSLLTGLRPDKTSVFANSVNFRATLPDVVTLPQLFRKNGYFTASLGKVFHRGGTIEEENAAMDDARAWEVTRYFQPTPLGQTGEGRNLTDGAAKWCRWQAAEGDDEDQPDGQVAREAIKLLEQQHDQPFFIAVGFHKPHDPFVSPRRYFELYPLEELPVHRDPAGATPALPLAISGDWKKVFARFSEQDEREFLRAYYAGVSFMDAQVGKVLDALDRLGLAERTIVVFLGDHGYHLGERGWWNKNTLFEWSSRAPLIIAAPGSTAAPRQTRAQPVEFVDLFPTLIDLCALAAPHTLDGRSLRPLLDDPAAPWDKPALTQVQRGKVMGRSVRTARWRYTEWDDGAQGTELYDHERDPGEWHNLADDPRHRQTIAKLKDLLRP